MCASEGARAPLVGALRSCSICWRMMSSPPDAGLRLSNARRTAEMGRAAHLGQSRTHGLDGRARCRNTAWLVLARLRAFAAVLAAAAALPAGAAAAPGSPLAAQLDRALHVRHVRLSASAAAAVDLATGESLYSRNGSLPLLPASNEKLAVTYAALTALGPDFRIETDVLGEGEQA